jgi:serine/threonine protein kinase
LNVETASDRAYFPPEIYKAETDIENINLKSVDMYSFGVVIHELISKTLPFNHQVESKLLSYENFTAQAFAQCSPQCKDFIQRLLKKNPSERLSCKEAALHPWI